MPRSNTIYRLLVITASIIMGYGCGGGLADQWNGPVSVIQISASADTNGANISRNLALKDASDTTVGSGDGTDGIDSIEDTAASTCSFELGNMEFTEGSNYIPIALVQQGESCTDLTFSQNKCIECNMEASGSDCSIVCQGVVPSNALTAGESITLKFSASAVFTTDMPAPDGVVRFDGTLTDWPYYDPQADLNYNIDACNNDAGEMGIIVDTSENGGPNSDNSTSETGWNHTFDISAVGDGTCSVVASLEENYSLSSLSTGGATLDITGGTIEIYSQICDTTNCNAPSDNKTFAGAIGGTGDESNMFAHIEALSNGNYVISTHTTSFGQEGGSPDAWMLELSETGVLLSENAYGGSIADIAYSVTPTSDEGGYIIAGLHDAGFYDYRAWIKKVGAGAFEYFYGATGENQTDEAHDIKQTSDGGYIFVGDTKSYTAGGNEDVWLVKLDSLGNVSWSRALGGSDEDNGVSVIEDSSGNFAVLSITNSFDGSGSRDCWVMKFNSSGTLLWDYVYGESALEEECYSIIETSDSNYLVAGYRTLGGGSRNIILLKLDPDDIAGDGSPVWQYEYGSVDLDQVFDVIESDGGYMLAGFTGSDPANFDALALKINTDGSIDWAKEYDLGGDEDVFISVAETPTGYMFVGHTASIGAGGHDTLVAAMDLNGDIVNCGIGSELLAPDFDGSLLSFVPAEPAISGPTSPTVDVNPSTMIEEPSVATLTSECGTLSRDEIIGFAKSFGGSRYDTAFEGEGIVTSDGGFLIVGLADSVGYGSGYEWALKLDGSGAVEWENKYEVATPNPQDAGLLRGAVQIADGGYVLAGYYGISGGVEEELLLIEISSSGAVEDVKSYGYDVGSGQENIQALIRTSDGGFATVGTVRSIGAGGHDYFFVKYDSDRVLQYSRAIGNAGSGDLGGDGDQALGLIQTSDGGYLLYGYSDSHDDAPDYDYDGWVVKLNSDASSIVWQNRYGTDIQKQVVFGAIEVGDGYLLVGKPYGLLVKVDKTNGNILEQYLYNSSDTDGGFFDIIEVPDGYLLAGDSYVSGFTDGDGWLLKVDKSDFSVIWERFYGDPTAGTSGGDNFKSVGRASNGSLLLAGDTQSFGVGVSDYWVVNTDSNGNLGGTCGIVTDTGSSSRQNNSLTATATSATMVSGNDPTSRTVGLTALPNPLSPTVGTQCPE